MRNLTFTERAIVVGAVFTLLLGAGLRYHRAHSAAAESVVHTQRSDAKG